MWTTPKRDSDPHHDAHSGLWHDKNDDSIDPLQPSYTDNMDDEEHAIDPSNLIPADHPSQENDRKDSRDSDIFDKDIPDELLL